MSNTRKGFSLLEFVIIVAIVAVLVAIVFPRLMKSEMQIVAKPEAALAPGSATPVAVKLVVGKKFPDENTRVHFAVVEGGGSVSPAETKTDATGQAKATWTLGTAPGTRNALTATSKDGATTRIEVFTTPAVAATPASTP